MAITGTLPLSSFQAGIETTFGTSVAATRKQPMISGTLNEHIERNFTVEQRNSLIRHYRTYPLKRWVELSMEAEPTFEDMPWFAQQFLEYRALNPAPTAVTGKRWDFMPKAQVDDLKFVTWEVANSTQSYDVTSCVGSRMELSWGTSQPMKLTVDYLGQLATAAAMTSNLSDRTTESINGALATAYIDTTTIGSTAVTNVLDARFAIDNHQMQFYALDGTLIPRDAYRGEARSAELELTVAFTDTTEYALFQSGASTATPRKVQILISGSSITGSSPASSKTFRIDWYGVWEESPFGTQDGLNVVKLKGQSLFDTTATHDWRMTVINDTASLA